MKTENQKTVEMIERNDTESIYNNIRNWTYLRDKHDNLIGDTFMELISEHSNDRNMKVVTTHCIDQDSNPSNEEAKSIAGEIIGNKSYYINLINEMGDKGRLDAIEVLKGLYPNKSDAEIEKMIG